MNYKSNEEEICPQVNLRDQVYHFHQKKENISHFSKYKSSNQISTFTFIISSFVIQIKYRYSCLPKTFLTHNETYPQQKPVRYSLNQSNGIKLQDQRNMNKETEGNAVIKQYEVGLLEDTLCTSASVTGLLTPFPVVS